MQRNQHQHTIEAWNLLSNKSASKAFDRSCFFEEFLANHATRIYEEVSRPCHAVKLSCGFAVQNLIGANNFGIGIGKQGKIDFAAIREIFQYGFAIVADARNLQSLFFESRLGVLQLDQLPFAIGSPICRTKEE